MTTIPTCALRNRETLAYYTNEWGRPPNGKRELFEGFALLIFQAGLSWSTVLRRRDMVREIFSHFNPDILAAWNERHIDRVLQDSRGIRNEYNIRAVVANARATVDVRAEGGLFHLIAMTFAHENADLGIDYQCYILVDVLKKRNFTFVGPRLCRSLLDSIGFTPGGSSTPRDASLRA